MMRFPMSTAPRDGRAIMVGDDEGNGPYAMRWEPEARNLLVGGMPGLWVYVHGGHFTWCDQFGYGPDWWQPLS